MRFSHSNVKLSRFLWILRCHIIYCLVKLSRYNVTVCPVFLFWDGSNVLRQRIFAARRTNIQEPVWNLDVTSRDVGNLQHLYVRRLMSGQLDLFHLFPSERFLQVHFSPQTLFISCVVPTVKCLYVVGWHFEKMEGTEPATVELSTDPCVPLPLTPPPFFPLAPLLWQGYGISSCVFKGEATCSQIYYERAILCTRSNNTEKNKKKKKRFTPHLESSDVPPAAAVSVSLEPSASGRRGRLLVALI